jgi:hypothetical protein
MPFAVSSFAALIKDQHYFVIFSPHTSEVLTALGCCVLFFWRWSPSLNGVTRSRRCRKDDKWNKKACMMQAFLFSHFIFSMLKNYMAV